MDKLIKDLLQKANAEGRLHVIEINRDDEPKCEGSCECGECYAESYEDVKAEAAEIAALNKILYDAHIDAGFTPKDAIRFAIAVIGCK